MKRIKRIVSCTIFLSLLPFATNSSARELEAAVGKLAVNEQQKKPKLLTPWTFSRACALGKLSARQKENDIRTLRVKYPNPDQSLAIEVANITLTITDEMLAAFPALKELTLETVNPKATIIYAATVHLKALRCISSAHMNIRIVKPLPDTLEALILDMTTESKYQEESICITLPTQPQPCRHIEREFSDNSFSLDVPQNVTFFKIVRHLKDPERGKIRDWRQLTAEGVFPWKK